MESSTALKDGEDGHGGAPHKLARGMSFAVAENVRSDVISVICFSLLGIGYLFPFSAMTQPVDYWHALFPDFNIEFTISAVYNYTNIVVLAILVFGLPPSKTGASMTQKVMWGFIGQFISLIIVPTSYFVCSSERANYVVILASTAFMAIVTAFVDSSVIALAALYPTKMQESLQLGVGLSTLIGSLFRVLTKGIFPPGLLIASSLAYFYAGAATLLVCLSCLFVLLFRPISIVAFRRSRVDHPLKGWPILARAEAAYDGGPPPGDAARLPLLAEEEEEDDDDAWPEAEEGGGPGSGPPGGPHAAHGLVLRGHAAEGEKKAGAAPAGGKRAGRRPLPPPGAAMARFPSIIVDRRKVVWRTLPNQLLVAATFCVTLAVWPALITEFRSRSFPGLQASGWWSLLLLLLFSVSDVVGRFCVGCRLGFISADTIWLPILLRALVVAPMLLSIKGVVPFLVHDGWPVFYAIVMGLSNGYLGTLSIIVVNEKLDHPQEKRYAGSFTSFYLNVGLVAGSTAGLLIENFFLFE